MARRLKDIIIHLDYEDEYKDGKVEVNIIASEPEELIRCKDCKFSPFEFDGNGNWGLCPLVDDFVREQTHDDYCSYGERREDGD